jgi:hypothetical protein
MRSATESHRFELSNAGQGICRRPIGNSPACLAEIIYVCARPCAQKRLDIPCAVGGESPMALQGEAVRSAGQMMESREQHALLA